MGIDFGTKRVGIALTDEGGTMAFPHAVVPNNPELVKALVRVIETKQVDEVVIGHSLDRNGGENSVQHQINELVTDLTLALGLPVHLQPEQYSTQAALRLQGRNDMTDASAAALILESYLLQKK